MFQGGEKNNFKFLLLILDKYFKFISLFSFVIILVAGMYFVFLPKLKEVQDKNKQDSFYNSESGNEDILEQKKEYLGKLKEFNREYLEINSIYFNKIDKILPHKLEPEKLFSQIEELITEQGMILTSMSLAGDVDFAGKKDLKITEVGVSDLVDKNIVKSVQIDIDIYGAGYNEMKRLLLLFENILPVVNIKEVNFPNSDTLSLKLETYY